jgi:molecular chaperone DnaK (HSP70)
MIGGTSRIPKVTTMIREYFGKDSETQIGSHINSDEAVAFGSALRAANLSHTFRVKQLYFHDQMNLDIKVIISTPDKGVLL